MRTRRTALLTLALAVTASPVLVAGPASAAVTTTTSDDAAVLAGALAGQGVTISNPVRTGGSASTGTFSGGQSVVGFDKGVTLSTGSADIGTTNTEDGSTGPNASGTGDPDLDTLAAPSETIDTSSLSFDVTASADTVYFNYVFASEEYSEYLAQGFNDVFGFFVGSQKANCAVVPDGPDAGSDPDPVSVDTINNGPDNTGVAASNPQLFRDNARDAGGNAPIAAEPDGFTTVLQCVAEVVPNQSTPIKLVIGDVRDDNYDSWVFVQANSISTAPVDPVDPTPTPSPNPGQVGGVAGPGLPTAMGSGAIKKRSFGFVATPNGGDVRVRRGKKLLTSGSVESFTRTGNVATWSGSCRIRRVGGTTSRVKARGCRYTIRVVDNGAAGDQVTFTVLRPKRSGLSFSGTVPSGGYVTVG